MLQPKGHAFPVRVYWEDTDAGGVVYHAGFLRFLERGRTELLRAHGIDQGRLFAEAGLAFAVRKMTIEFLAAARLDDLLMVATMLEDVRGASAALRQTIVRGDTVLVEAAVTLACVGAGRARKIPADLREKLRAARS